MPSLSIEPFTKVRITLDNTSFCQTSIVWQPTAFVITGTVQPSNSWDEPGTLHLVCPGGHMKHVVIPTRIIQKIETKIDDGETSDITNFEPIRGKTTERVFMIESSKADTFYRVTKIEDKWACNCIAGLHQKTCRHILEARKINDNAES